jgi:serine O-acetyltransferase
VTLRQTFSDLRDAWDVHGRSLRHRAFWAMAFYHYGRYILSMRRHPVRWLLNLPYAFFSTFTPIVTGVSLDRTTRIGKRLHIIHPGMVLIHPQVVLGDRVGLMHGVTLGTSPTNPGVPTLGNDVFVGAHATILGGVTIGDGARIAANSLIICDVPAGATAIGVPAKVYPARPESAPPVAEAQPQLRPASRNRPDPIPRHAEVG